jgi:tRNA acetyltransferase TAN1
LNLIVTCARHFEEETKEEIKNILNELGDSAPDIQITEVSGILIVQTSLDASQIIKKIRTKLEDEPWSIRYTMRLIPIFQAAKTDVLEITNAALGQIQKMKPDETYRITIEKRNSGISSSQIIDSIADKIMNKVSLEKFDWIVLVEIIEGISGVSILREEDVLSVNKAKRLSE